MFSINYMFRENSRYVILPFFVTFHKKPWHLVMLTLQARSMRQTSYN